MDAPTYAQLHPPAIVIQANEQSSCASLEGKVRSYADLAKKPAGKYQSISKILGELKRPLKTSHYEKETANGTVVNELRFDPMTNELVAGFYYYMDRSGTQKIDKIIYMSGKGVPIIIFYYNGTAPEQWHDPRKVSNVHFDSTSSFIHEPGERCKYIETAEEDKKQFEKEIEQFKKNEMEQKRKLKEWFEREIEKWRKNKEGSQIFA
ncbi:hypothetical protein HYX08_02455 [Candidatus Woesearchaeota archaeon]|nr:hypothetical protein [Candidatus Woesearchaeota archaeon]